MKKVDTIVIRKITSLAKELHLNKDIAPLYSKVDKIMTHVDVNIFHIGSRTKLSIYDIQNKTILQKNKKDNKLDTNIMEKL